MKHKTKFMISIGLLIVFSLSANSALANKSSVTIDAPESVEQGSEIIININVGHDSNSMFHYTKWVYVMINGKEIARWDYTWSKRPEGSNFTKEVLYTVNEPIEIAAEASVDLVVVWNVLDEYKKKKYIKISYSGNPDFVPILTKKIPPMAVQLRLMSNLEYKIAKLCDGTRTIEEIEEKLDIDGDKLSELIDRMEKNKMIRMDIKRA